jgi:molybdopterin synthase sulfur carrier subunit
MKVNFYATLRQIVGRKTVEIDLGENNTVQELLDTVMDQYPPLRRELLDENGDLYPHVHVFINGRDAPYLENALDTDLESSDKVDIFPAVGGG